MNPRTKSLLPYAPSRGGEGNVFWFQLENKLIMWKYVNALCCGERPLSVEKCSLCWALSVISSRRSCPFLMHEHYWLAHDSLLQIKTICIIWYYFRLVRMYRIPWEQTVPAASRWSGQTTLVSGHRSLFTCIYVPCHLRLLFSDCAYAKSLLLNMCISLGWLMYHRAIISDKWI